MHLISYLYEDKLSKESKEGMAFIQYKAVINS